jgi:hypothetical protein
VYIILSQILHSETSELMVVILIKENRLLDGYNCDAEAGHLLV